MVSTMIAVLLLLSGVLVSSIQPTDAAELKQLRDVDPEDRYSQLLRRVENLEQRERDHIQEVDTLRSELRQEKKNTARLGKVMQRLIRKQGGWRKYTANTDMKEKDTKAHDLGKEAPLDIIEDTREVRRPGIRQTSVQARAVAFHATLAGHMENVGVHQNIVFENVVTNLGTAYNAHIGVFVAPVSGVYVFSTTVLGLLKQAIHCAVVQNGNATAMLYIRSIESLYGNDSGTVVLHLAKGDDVAIQNIDAGTSINGNHFSMFSGFLLQPDDPEFTFG